MEPLPEATARFLKANIDSVEQLEVLRALAADRNRVWDCRALAGEVQARPQAVARHLDALERRGLITVARGPIPTYRYGANTPELEDAVSRLLQLYNERPVTLIRLVYEHAGGGHKTLADALLLRKER